MLCLGFLTSGYALPDNKEGTYVPGHLIVQLRSIKGQSDETVRGLEEDFSTAGLEMLKTLSERMGIYLFRYSQERVVSDQVILQEVKKHKLVLEAQFNHYVELRETEPDDPSYPDQWALKNTGQLNGVIDADIDATDAWDTNTGGISSLGDTIIIAIIDDGFNLGHDDIDFWENYHEIPGNGIDDDNNGYVDDYRGWNAYSSTGTITSKDHGTHVTGIAGAIGNNGVGVTGVNWDAKILPVMGSTQIESVVVEAYGYVYAQRAKYNETSGAAGAYIVVSNCSFGVNYGQPEDYPIWGAMYDSLGRLGILSAGATANMNVNIDEVGDIPTAFQSDFLITVTNTTMQDEKYLSAGWGPESIDLGAPGKNIFSTKQGNSYGYKTGTSMSAPHVSGVVALMFAAAGPGFMQSYQDHPEELSLLIKHYILQGTDELPSLVDSTVSGGRLNVHQAITLMLTHVLASDTDSLNITLLIDSTASESLQLINQYDMDLPFEVRSEENPPWLSLEPSSGVLPALSAVQITAEFDAGGLEQDVYTSEIEAVNIRGDKVLIPVQMTVNDPAGIELLPENKPTLTVFPNPFRDQVHINIELNVGEQISLDIIDQNGRLILNVFDGYVHRGRTVFSWDGCDEKGNRLVEGIYYCRMKSGSGSSIAKLLLIK